MTTDSGKRVSTAPHKDDDEETLALLREAEAKLAAVKERREAMKNEKALRPRMQRIAFEMLYAQAKESQNAAELARLDNLLNEARPKAEAEKNRAKLATAKSRDDSSDSVGGALAHSPADTGA